MAGRAKTDHRETFEQVEKHLCYQRVHKPKRVITNPLHIIDFGVHGGDHDAAANGRGQALGTMDRALSEPGKSGQAAVQSQSLELTISVGIVRVKVEPFSSSLSTAIFPPSSAVNSLTIYNPSPTPSKERLCELSTW